jgi:hypothetical protein
MRAAFLTIALSVLSGAACSPYTLTTFGLEITIVGDGKVQAPGINCPGTCLGGSFIPGQTAVLTATASPGSAFVSWGGNCSGTSATTSVTFGTHGNKACTASFETVTPPPPPPPPPPGAVLIEDSFSSGAQWNTLIVQSTGNPVDPQSAGTVANGGNPGGYRSMTHTFSQGGEIWVDHLYAGSTYNPSQQGAITSIDFSADRIILSAPFSGAGVADWFVVVQSTQVFTRAASPNVFSNTAWLNTSQPGLVAADFQPAPGPNFSATGGPLQFGYRRANTNSSTTGYLISHGIDNWRVVIHR